MIKKITLGIIVSFISLSTFAQVTGPNPNSIKWKYIDSEAVKVVFPEGNLEQATRAANIINYVYNSNTETVGLKRKHLELVIQTNQVVSNGYVALAPYRSEYYASALQNFNLLGSVDWIDLLSLHEYRHAIQIRNSRVGLTNALYFLGGESLWNLGTFLSVPNWYLEGDAVQTETVLSQAGRGRTPSFFELQRSMLLDDVKYSYRKAWLGSYRDLMPNHYNVGYSILHEVRAENDPTVWATILKQGAGYRGLFYSFSRAMKRNTGYSAPETYNIAYDKLRDKWKKELETLEIIPSTRITEQSKKEVTNYTWPQTLDDGSIVALKGTFSKTTELIQIKDGKEKHLATLGQQVFEASIAENNGRIAWTDLSRDPRWANRNYNDIKAYDTNTGKYHTIATKTKYFAPQYSSDGNSLVVIKADEHLKNNIVFLDAATGEATSVVANPENDFLSFPKWTKDDEAIVYLSKRNNRIALFKYDIPSKSVTQLSPWSHHVIGGISVGDGIVYYQAAYSGINNVFTVDLNGNKEIKQITSVKIGANTPAISSDGNTLFFTQIDYMGYGLYEQNVNLSSAKSYQIVEPVDQERYAIRTTNIENNILDKIPNTQYEVKDFDGPFHSPKLHSWALGLKTDFSQADITLGINNTLNDFGASVTYGYNFNENVNVFSGRIDYSRFYIPFNLHGFANGRTIVAPTNLSNTGTYDSNDITFTETRYGLGVDLPLQWYRGIFTTGIDIAGNFDFLNTSEYAFNDTDLSTEYDLKVAEGVFSFYNLRQTAHQNVGTRFGQILSFYYGTSVDGASAEKMTAKASLYFPGIFPNHNINIKGGYTKEDLTNDYRFLDDFEHARGYIPILGDEEMIISAEYNFPLFYPERGIPGVTYIKRIRGNLFADFSQVTRDALDQTFDQNSVGATLFFDSTFFHIMSFSVGIQYAALLEQDYYDDKTSNVGVVVQAGF